MGWDVNVHGTLMMLRCPLGLGWGGWDVNVHGTLMMLRCPLGLGWGGMLRWRQRDDKLPQRRVKKHALQDTSTVAAVSEMCFLVSLDISDCLEFI